MVGTRCPASHHHVSKPCRCRRCPGRAGGARQSAGRGGRAEPLQPRPHHQKRREHRQQHRQVREQGQRPRQRRPQGVHLHQQQEPLRVRGLRRHQERRRSHQGDQLHQWVWLRLVPDSRTFKMSIDETNTRQLNRS
ncbi:hypothetical protein FOCC_FOCC006548 [Frankliniella occidentalis]|nr:hypothetical protein FOCC_FOCC006548 [Frankliniella occidentalis]